MLNLHKIWVVLFCCFLLGSSILNADQASLSMDSFIEKIMENLPEKRITLMDLSLAEQDYLKTKEIYDIQWKSSLGYEGSTAAGSIPNLQLDYAQTLVGKTVWSKLFKDWGTKVEAGFQVVQQNQAGLLNTVSAVDAATHLAITTTTDYERSSLAPQLYAGFTHPLLKNKNGEISEYPSIHMQQLVKLKKYGSKLLLEEVKNKYRKLYLNWAAQKKITNLLLDALNTANLFYQDMLQKKQEGIIDGDDLEKAYSAYQRLVIQQKDAEQQLAVIETEFSDFFDLKTVFIDYDQLKNTGINLKEYENTFQDTFPYYLNEINQVILKSELKFHQSRTEADLNLTANLFAGSKVTAQALLSYSRSLDNTEVKASIAAVKIKLAQLLERQADLQLRFQQQTQNLKKEINTHLQALKLHADVLASLSRRQKVEQHKYRQARLNLSYILESENQFIQEQIAYWKRLSRLQQAFQDFKLWHFSVSDKKG